MTYTQKLEKQIQNLQAKLKAAEKLIDNHPFLNLHIGSDDTGLKQTLMQNLKDITIVHIENNMSYVGDFNEIRIKYLIKNQPITSSFDYKSYLPFENSVLKKGNLA